uniref:Uncharacterized protein n=1 Tax=Rhizophora mucronata TaxID=61149 RepID=A0A2P2N9G1_RHIMU
MHSNKQSHSFIHSNYQPVVNKSRGKGVEKNHCGRSLLKTL